MKPLVLTMQSFGSYGKKTVIDFRKPNQNLFLITGDTGSGKSTIFDAIVFALYGEASSGTSKKDGAELQSQYADLDCEPYVELIFSEKRAGEDEVYTVRRTPRHVRALKRGTGVKEEKESVSLLLPDGMEFSANKKDTDRKLEEISGLSKEQFMQVAMIAQGEFMNVIQSTSDEKKKIFRKLFKTEKFQKIVDELKERKDSMGSAMDQIRAELRAEIGHIVCPELGKSEYAESSMSEGFALNKSENPDESIFESKNMPKIDGGDYCGSEDMFYLYNEIETLKNRVISASNVSFADVDLLIPKLEAACDDLEKRTNAAGLRLEEARGKRDDAKAELARANTLKRSFDELEESEKVLKDCEEKSEEIREGKKLAEKITASYEIRNAYKVYEFALEEVKSRKSDLESQKEKLPGLVELEKNMSIKAKEALSEYETYGNEYVSVCESVERAEALFGKIEKEEKNLDLVEKLAESAKQQASEYAKALADLAEKESSWTRDIDERKDAKENLLMWKNRHERFAETEEKLNDLVEIQKATEIDEKKLEKVKKEYKSAREMYGEKQNEYIKKNNMFLDAQAGFIAREKLMDGQPCPVCGSVQHPAPAGLSDEHRELTRDIIDKLSEDARRLNQLQQEKAEMARELTQAVNAGCSRIEDGLAKLQREMIAMYGVEPVEDFDIDMAYEICYREKSKSKEEGKALKQAVSELELAQNNLEKSKSKRERLEEELKKAESTSIDANSKKSLCKERIEILKKDLIYSSREEAKASLRAAEDKKKSREAIYRKADKDLVDVRAKKEKCQALIDKASVEIPISEEKAEDSLKGYREVLERKGISEKEWKGIVTEYDVSYADKINKIASDFEKRKAAAQGALETAKKSIGNSKKPDIPHVQALEKQTEEYMQIAERVYDEIKRIYEADKGVYMNLIPKMENHRKAAAEFTRIESMHSRLSGKVTGARMDIETFVQRYYLERILYVANRRFSVMTSGQFELRMTDIERAGEGRNRGLDLMVYSFVTASEREIKTLSGGEKFMAALALALGMSDQIQESTASINLDIMFIDEGFGSLSDGSRSQAVRVLQDMAEGDRLIGIISHVSELKQEIENQLTVRKDDDGSHVSWSIS